MARNTINYTVTDPGRDLGKVFVITEMSTLKAEKWAMRALLALMNGNVDMPQGFERAGMAAMAEMGLKALGHLKFEVAEPLLNEMFECVKIMPDPAKPQLVRALIDEDIEEIMTRFKLRIEVWRLHTGFLKAAALSIYESAQAAVAK